MKVAQPPACTNCQTRDNNIILKDCPIDRLEQLNENKSCVAYEKGQNLFHECQPSLGVFCLFTGKVKIFRTGPHGREHIVRLAKPGDLIGYRALLGDESYTATAVTLEDSTACFVPKEEFLTAIKGDNPNIFSRLFKLLSRDLAEAERRLTNMAQKSVRERLAEAILLMDASYGQKNGNSSMIDVMLSREDLANLVGTATETVIRLLSEFKDERLIRNEGKKIRILDRKHLMRVASLTD